MKNLTIALSLLCSLNISAQSDSASVITYTASWPGSTLLDAGGFYLSDPTIVIIGQDTSWAVDSVTPGVGGRGKGIIIPGIGYCDPFFTPPSKPCIIEHYYEIMIMAPAGKQAAWKEKDSAFTVKDSLQAIKALWFSLNEQMKEYQKQKEQLDAAQEALRHISIPWTDKSKSKFTKAVIEYNKVFDKYNK